MLAMSDLGQPAPSRYPVRMGAMLAAALIGALVACGSTNSHANDTLPPIATTTTTTTLPPTTTTIPDKYVIKKGDSLSGIAKMFGVTTQELAAYNGITNPEHIESGQTIKIPQPDQTATTIAVTTVPGTGGAPSSTAPISAP
ncbi:MAG: hypothetical protein JWM34_3133 [Ilumatobacteraceae bacterium]|nr:hypothetical protein [Ilumatobacteraceae bacterium]